MGTKRVFAVLSVLACACDPVVDPVGVVEVAGQQDCYRWGQSVLRDSRPPPQAEVMTFSGGDLYYAGTPGAVDVLKADGRSGTDWTVSLGPELDQTGWARAIDAWPTGGVVVLSGSIFAFEIVRVDEDGGASRLAALEYEQGSYAVEVAAFPGGFVVAGIGGPEDHPEELSLWSFDDDGVERWQYTVPTEFTRWGNWDDMGLAVGVDDDGNVTAVVADDALGDEPGASGLRRIELSAAGDLLSDQVVVVPGRPVDVALHGDSTFSVLLASPDVVEVRHLDASMQTLWVSHPRDGFSIAGHRLVWNPHTNRLLMAGANRPNGGASHGWYVVLDEDGEVEWEKTTGSRVWSVAQDPRGGFVALEWVSHFRVRQVLPSSCG